MNQPIQVDPEVLLRAAAGHMETADELRKVPQSNEEWAAVLKALGPVYGAVRAEGLIKLEQRAAAYEAHAAAHEGMHADLTAINARWAGQQDESRAAIEGVIST